MFSVRSCRILVFITKWTSFFGGMPFTWDDKRSKLKYSERAWSKWTCWTFWLFINAAAYFAKLAVSILIVPKEKRNDPSFVYKKVRGYEIVAIYTIAILMAINTWCHLEDIVCFLNSLIRYCQHFRNSNIKRLGRHWRNGCETILLGLMILMLLFPILSILLFISDPRDFRFLTSVLPPPNQMLPRWLYNFIVVGFGIIHGFWTFSAISCMIFYAMMCILASFVTFQILREIKGGEHYYFSRPVVRRPPRVCHVYRALQILNRLWNTALTTGLYPWTLGAQMFSIVGNSILIKFWKNERPISRLLLFLGPNIYLATWLLSFQLYALLFQRSKVVVQSWQYLRLKAYGDFLYMAKFRKSAEPLKLKIGSIKVIKLPTVVATLHSTIRQTFKSLLTIQKKLK